MPDDTTQRGSPFCRFFSFYMTIFSYFYVENFFSPENFDLEGFSGDKGAGEIIRRTWIGSFVMLKIQISRETFAWFLKSFDGKFHDFFAKFRVITKSRLVNCMGLLKQSFGVDNKDISSPKK